MPENIEYPKGKHPRLRLVVSPDLQEAVGRITGKNRRVANLRESFATADPTVIKRRHPEIKGRLRAIIDAAEAMVKLGLPVTVFDLRSPERYGFAGNAALSGSFASHRFLVLPANTPGLIPVGGGVHVIDDDAATSAPSALPIEAANAAPMQRADEPTPIELAHISYAEIICEWEKGREGRTSKKAREAMQSKMKRLAGFLHDRDHKKITLEELADFDGSGVTTTDLLRYRSHLLDLKQRGKIEPKTVEDHVSMLRQLFKAAYNAGDRLRSNPADDDRFAYQGKTREQNKRTAGFTKDERARMYRLAQDAEPVVKFMTLFGLWLGPRNAEIAELTTYEIEDAGDDGLPVCRIRLDHRPPEQCLKVDDVSPRPVPIPQAWAADRVITEHGHGPLFPSVPLDSDRRRNDNATNRVNAWLHDVVKTPKTYYWHRHTFKTLARPPVMATETHDAITGHGGGNMGRGYGYYEMWKMRAAIEQDVFNAVEAAYAEAAE